MPPRLFAVTHPVFGRSLWPYTGVPRQHRPASAPLRKTRQGSPWPSQAEGLKTNASSCQRAAHSSVTPRAARWFLTFWEAKKRKPKKERPRHIHFGVSPTTPPPKKKKKRKKGEAKVSAKKKEKQKKAKSKRKEKERRSKRRRHLPFEPQEPRRRPAAAPAASPPPARPPAPGLGPTTRPRRGRASKCPGVQPGGFNPVKNTTTFKTCREIGE